MASIPIKVGDRTVWMREGDEMAEQIKVVSDGEEVVLTAEGAGGRCEVRLKLEEAERLRDILDRAVIRADGAREAREAEEALEFGELDEVGKISGVDEGGGA